MNSRTVALAALFMAAFLPLRAENWQDYAEQSQKAFVAKNYEESVKLCSEAIRLQPRNPFLYFMRARAESLLDRHEAALRDFDVGFEFLPEDDPKDLAMAYLYRSKIQQRAGKAAEELKDLEEAWRLDPSVKGVRNDLAWVLSTSPQKELRDPKRGIELAWTEVNKLKWKEAASIDTLAAAYAAAGRFEEAVRVQERAIALIRDEGEKEDAQKRLDLYREKKAYVGEKGQE